MYPVKEASDDSISECLILYRSPYARGVPRSSHVLFAAYHKARPSRAINEDVYYYYYYYDSIERVIRYGW